MLKGGFELDNTIDLSKSLFDICNEHPDIIEIMKDLGFKNITTPGILNTAGRFMTIPKGAAMKKINMDIIEDEFNKRGYKLIG